ncbi:MAG: serine hydrolase domain-containing protein [Cyclobacteriaceae bacterium]
MRKIIQIPVWLLLLSCSDNLKNPFEDSIEQSTSYVETYMESNKVPGMQIAVSHQGDIVWSKGFGYSNLEFSIPVDQEAKFRIASVSKPVAAVLTARLYQSEVIDIDKSVSEKLPQFSNEKEFTLRQLFSHAAGIRHYSSKDSSTAVYHDDIQTGLNIVKGDTLLYTPGDRFSYSSYGYNVAGAYTEKVLEQQFEDLLIDSLFIPLQMKNSTIDDPFKLIPKRVSGYELNVEGEITNARFFDNRYKIPAGGMLSTAEDLVGLGNELLYGEYLNDNSKGLLFTPFKYTVEKESDLGFGWLVTKDESGNSVYAHLGGNTGGCSVILIYPDLELIVVWLGNRDVDWSPVPAFTVADFFMDKIESE